MSRRERGAWSADPQLLDGMLGPPTGGPPAKPWQRLRAENVYDAVMRTPPGEEPDESVAEQDELREVVADAFDTLTEDEQWIFHMLKNVRLSLRFTGSVIGIPKTTLARRRDRIIRKLQDALLESPLIRERLGL